MGGAVRSSSAPGSSWDERITVAPFHVMVRTPGGAQTVIVVAALVSPVSRSVEPLMAAVRTSSGPCSRTGPAAVSWRQKPSAVVVSASSRVRPGRPPPLIWTWARPL